MFSWSWSWCVDKCNARGSASLTCRCGSQSPISTRTWAPASWASSRVRDVCVCVCEALVGCEPLFPNLCSCAFSLVGTKPRTATSGGVTRCAHSRVLAAGTIKRGESLIVLPNKTNVVVEEIFIDHQDGSVQLTGMLIRVQGCGRGSGARRCTVFVCWYECY